MTPERRNEVAPKEIEPASPSAHVPVTIMLDPETHKQIEQQATSWGETVQEWLMEAIEQKL